MAQTLPPELDVVPWVRGPSLRVRSLVALLLRFGLGVQLLNAGVIGFFLNQAGRPGGMPTWGSGYGRTGIDPGALIAYGYLPYIQIVTALALLLGFLTVTAATLAALVTLAPSLFESVILMGNGLSTNPGAFDSLVTPAVVHGAMVVNLFLAVSVIWLAASGCNVWSLDGLMFAPRWRRSRSGEKSPRGRGKAGS